MTVIRIRAGADAAAVRRRLTELGLWTDRLASSEASAGELLRVQPQSARVDAAAIGAIEGVVEVITAPLLYPKVASARGVAVRVGSLEIGAGAPPVLMAGPCSVESEHQIERVAAYAASSGARILRGGCYKPRTNPYSFRGVGAEGLLWMRQAADRHGLFVVTEAMAPGHVEPVARYADLFQVGARNMQNFDLLQAIGRAKMPVLLKRGLSATIGEWLQAGEHLVAAGASGVIFCERGIRAPNERTRFVFDLGAVSLMRHAEGLAIVADPSHACGRKDLIGPLGAAALAAGADGLIIETHHDPGSACSDAPQQLDEREFRAASATWGFEPGAARQAGARTRKEGRR